MTIDEMQQLKSELKTDRTRMGKPTTLHLLASELQTLRTT
jgi:hypothetical protein